MSGMAAVYGPNNGTPRIQQYVADGGATYDAGDVLVLTSGLATGAGANPGAGTILGVSCNAYNAAPGYNMANQPSIVTHRAANTSVYMANGNIFKSKLTNGSATFIAPVAADIGASYGITANSGVWSVDKSKTAANARVVIVKIDPDQNEVYWRFIESYCVEI